MFNWVEVWKTRVSRQGAVPVEEEEREQKKQRSSAFQGTGFRLGDIEGPSQSGGNGAPPSPRQEKVSKFSYCLE